MSKYNKKILSLLAKKMKINEDSVKQAVIRKKKKILKELKFSLKSELVFLILALENEIDIIAYVTTDESTKATEWQIKIEQKKSSIFSTIKEESTKSKSEIKKKAKKRTKEIKLPEIEIKGNFIKIDKQEIDVSYIPQIVIKEIISMKDIYPWIYLFENSARNLIIKIMCNNYGKNWWNLISKKIRDNVYRRKQKEKKHQWHRGKRNTQSIYYTDLNDLNKIIKNRWNDFKTIFPSTDFVGALFDSIELSRNIIAHNNPLPKNERDDLIKDIKRWFRQIENRI